METEQAILSLAALAQGTRLEAFRLLVRHAPSGLGAGALAQALAVPQNTLSAHLNVLAQAGLVHGTRQGRSITYRADIARLGSLAGFLLHDCCGGRPEACQPVFAPISCSAQKEPC